MREIKFRAWGHQDDGQCEMFYEFTDFDKYFIPEAYDVPICDHVLMQYTGLKDKNEKEIYEGDIVDFTFFYYGETEVEISKKGEIVFDDFGFCFKANEEEDYLLGNLTFDSESDIEVIGNKYENPELIK